MSDYWFARRFPVGHPRNAVAPVSREGRMVFVYWAAAMAAGALIWLLLTLTGAFFGGVLVFVVVTVLATWLLFSLTFRRTDNTRTVDDYKRAAGGRT